VGTNDHHPNLRSSPLGQMARGWEAVDRKIRGKAMSDEMRLWREQGRSPNRICPFCASRISVVERDGRFFARCSHRGCGARGPKHQDMVRACDLFCCPPRWFRRIWQNGGRQAAVVPTEFFEGEWHFPKADGPEPWAVITYTQEPSPETGHVGWCWWAMGAMGDAPTYEAARDAAVAEIQRRMDNIMEEL